MPILAQNYPVYQPAMRVIGFINDSGSSLTRVVTTIPHQYKAGIIVRLNLPVGYSPQGLNQKVGTIVDIIDATSFHVDIDSSQLEDFSSPNSFPDDRQYAQVTPIGEINSKLEYATRNVLPY